MVTTLFTACRELIPIYFCVSNATFFQAATKVFIDEQELETYIRSDLYGVFDEVRSVWFLLFFSTPLSLSLSCREEQHAEYLVVMLLVSIIITMASLMLLDFLFCLEAVVL